MTNFKQYTRTNIAEMTPWTEEVDMERVSVSQSDQENGSPKEGDMIARNPKDHSDQWLVAEKYFNENFAVSSTPEYQQRVLEERNLLKDKIEKLEIFLEQQSFLEITSDPDISLDELDDLRQQSRAMKAYYNALNIRIGKFSA